MVMKMMVEMTCLNHNIQYWTSVTMVMSP